MPRTLLVDTGFSAAPILEELEKLKHEVHIVGKNPSDALAKASPNYHEADYANEHELIKVIEKVKPSFLVPGGNDQSYISCARVNKIFQFPGIDSEEKCAALFNKALFRETANRLNIPIPYYYNQANLDLCTHNLIIKPTDSFSGKGINVVAGSERDKLSIAINEAKSQSKSGSVVIEDFIDGQLYSHSAFIYNGKIVRDFWVVEYSSINPFVVDTSHLVFDLDVEIRRSVRKNIEELVLNLNLTNGLIHTQFILNRNKYFLIEVTRRCPGDLYSKLIETSTGYNYAKAYISGFLDDSSPATHSETTLSDNVTTHIIRHTIAQNSTCVYRSIRFHRPVHIRSMTTIASPGDLLRPSPLGRVAVVLFELSSYEKLLAMTKKIINHDLYTIY